MLFGVKEANSPAVEVALKDREKFGLNGDAAFFAAFAFDVDDCGTIIGSVDVANVGPAEFLGAQAGQQSGQY